MRYILSVFLAAILVCSSTFSLAQIQKFEIMGEVEGFPDSTLIYLHELDSALIIKNQFHFTGSLKEDAKQVILTTKNFGDYKFFWLENSQVKFKATKGKFREAIITGSKTQADLDKLSNAINAGGNEKEQNMAFIRTHPNSIISANILSVYASTWGKDTTTILYHALSKKMKTTSYGKDILDFITLNKDIKVGDKYVDFRQQNIEGKNLSLSDLQGKVVLLEFWGSWCVPCRKGHPELLKIYKEFNNAGFEIFGVAAESNKELWIAAVREDGLLWQNVSDLKGDKNKAALIYGISYYPTNYLIDKNGTIVAKDLRGDDLRKKLLEMMPGGLPVEANK